MMEKTKVPFPSFGGSFQKLFWHHNIEIKTNKTFHSKNAELFLEILVYRKNILMENFMILLNVKHFSFHLVPSICNISENKVHLLSFTKH